MRPSPSGTDSSCVNFLRKALALLPSILHFCINAAGVDRDFAVGLSVSTADRCIMVHTAAGNDYATVYRYVAALVFTGLMVAANAGVLRLIYFSFIFILRLFLTYEFSGLVLLPVDRQRCAFVNTDSLQILCFNTVTEDNVCIS